LPTRRFLANFDDPTAPAEPVSHVTRSTHRFVVIREGFTLAAVD